MTITGEVKKLAAFCEKNLDIASSSLGDEYGYPNVPLCVIDAVYSIGIRYTTTRNVVKRFCDYFKIPMTCAVFPPPQKEQLSVSEFVSMFEGRSIQNMTDAVFQNKNRTSPKSGILKSDAVFQFSKILKEFSIEYLQDVEKILGLPEFETAIKNIPGQGSGLSLRYFYMLAGEKNYIKPDRMILRFIEEVIGKDVGLDEATELIVESCELLKEKYPQITPRFLDNLIWNYQREQ